jgi:hypothetical protein
VDRCELLMSQDGLHACLPTESPLGVLQPCGKPAIKQVQAVSGELIWVCADHHDKLERRERAVTAWENPLPSKAIN